MEVDSPITEVEVEIAKKDVKDVDTTTTEGMDPILNLTVDLHEITLLSFLIMLNLFENFTMGKYC